MDLSEIAFPAGMMEESKPFSVLWPQQNAFYILISQ